jgi:site-specific recombinase XerD
MLQRRNYATTTVQCYIQAVERFAKHFRRPPDHLNQAHLREYQAYLLRDRKLESRTVKLHVYWRWMKPKTWLFPRTIAGWCVDKPITPKVVWDACQAAATRARIEKRGFRAPPGDSYATHLLEAGADCARFSCCSGTSSSDTPWSTCICRGGTCTG